MTLQFFKGLAATLPRRHRYHVAGVALALEQAIQGGETPALAVARIGSDRNYQGVLVESGQVANFQSIAPPAPVLDRLSISSFVIGQRNISLHCLGSGFTPDSQINFAGQDERTDFWSPSDVSTGIYAELWTGPDQIEVFVTTPNGVTDPLLFSIVSGDPMP